MDDLNPKARALVKAGRRAVRASTVDRERIEAALREQLGASALPPEAGVARVVASALKREPLRLALGSAVVVGAGAALVALLASAPAATPRAAPIAELPITTPAPLWLPDARAAVANLQDSTDAAVSAVQTAVPLASAPPKHAQSPRRAPDRLAQEVALLSRATAELRAGHAARALKLLDEHQQKFPDGALGEDRRTAKAQALCLLGRVAEGRAEAALLPPHSPASARAQRTCDADPAGSERP